MKKLSAFFVILFITAKLFSLDLWRNPEAAETGSVFTDVRFAVIHLTDGFYIPPAEAGIDYLAPFPLPLSLGAFIKTPDPNLKEFGVRAAYHIDVRDKKTDLYFLYVFDFGFLRNDILAEYGDEEQEIRYYDFRAGVRRLFGKYTALTVESGYKFREIIFGLSLKIN
jgi:hypothetical protein